MLSSGAYAGFLRGGGPNFKISGILDIHFAACREQRSCEPLLGGFGGMPPPKKIFINGWPFYNAAPPLIYLNIDDMDT